MLLDYCDLNSGKAKIALDFINFETTIADRHVKLWFTFFFREKKCGFTFYTMFTSSSRDHTLEN
jgi:hypothetical protein